MAAFIARMIYKCLAVGSYLLIARHVPARKWWAAAIPPPLPQHKERNDSYHRRKRCDSADDASNDCACVADGSHDICCEHMEHNNSCQRSQRCHAANDTSSKWVLCCNITIVNCS